MTLIFEANSALSCQNGFFFRVLAQCGKLKKHLLFSRVLSPWLIFLMVEQEAGEAHSELTIKNNSAKKYDYLKRKNQHFWGKISPFLPLVYSHRSKIKFNKHFLCDFRKFFIEIFGALCFLALIIITQHIIYYQSFRSFF